MEKTKTIETNKPKSLPLKKESFKRNIRQTRDLPRLHFKIGLTELKMLQFFFGKIKRNDTDFFEGTATVQEISEYCGFTGDEKNKYKLIKETSINLSECSLRYKNNKDKYEIIPWMAYIKYDRGTIRYKINPEIKNELLQLHKDKKLYIDIDPDLLPLFRTQYGLRIYMILKGIPAGSETEQFYSTKDISNMLVLSKSYDPEKSPNAASNQKVAILNPAVNEINKITDIIVSCTGIKKRNEIIGWEFKVNDDKIEIGEKTKKDIRNEKIDKAKNWNEIIDIIEEENKKDAFTIAAEIREIIKIKPDLYATFCYKYFQCYGKIFDLNQEIHKLFDYINAIKNNEKFKGSNVDTFKLKLNNFKLKQYN